MRTFPAIRALSALALCLAAVGCVATSRTSFEAQHEWTFEFSVDTVDQAVPRALDKLGMAIVELAFDGAVGYVRAETPAGAVVQLSYESMTRDRTYVRVRCTRRYGAELSQTIISAVYEEAEVVAG